MLAYTAENAAALTTKYGNVTKATVGTIQRQLLALDSQGGAQFFGEPALEIDDFIRTDEQGRGVINILAADKLMRSPKLYATFLLWLLAELFEVLPEVGDPDKPKLVFFFDEAHLLFDDAPRCAAGEDRAGRAADPLEGRGVYFVTQNPIDIPEEVAGQLGNRVQHALRAFTPRDQKAIRAAAETFRINPDLNVETAITELKVGEALVSTLLEDGAPSVVQRTLVKPPRSRARPGRPTKERAIVQSISPFAGKYDTPRRPRELRGSARAEGGRTRPRPLQEVAEKGREEVGKRERKTARASGGKAAKAAAGAGAGLGRARSPPRAVTGKQVALEPDAQRRHCRLPDRSPTNSAGRSPRPLRAQPDRRVDALGDVEPALTEDPPAGREIPHRNRDRLYRAFSHSPISRASRGSVSSRSRIWTMRRSMPRRSSAGELSRRPLELIDHRRIARGGGEPGDVADLTRGIDQRLDFRAIGQREVERQGRRALGDLGDHVGAARAGLAGQGEVERLLRQSGVAHLPSRA